MSYINRRLANQLLAGRSQSELLPALLLWPHAAQNPVHPQNARTILPVAWSVSIVTRSCLRSIVTGSPGLI